MSMDSHMKTVNKKIQAAQTLILDAVIRGQADTGKEHVATYLSIAQAYLEGAVKDINGIITQTYETSGADRDESALTIPALCD